MSIQTLNFEPRGVSSTDGGTDGRVAKSGAAGIHYSYVRTDFRNSLCFSSVQSQGALNRFDWHWGERGETRKNLKGVDLASLMQMNGVSTLRIEAGKIHRIRLDALASGLGGSFSTSYRAPRKAVFNGWNNTFD